MKSNSAKPKIKNSLPNDLLVSGVREVNRYLHSYPNLAAIVSAMARRAREEFGKTAELTLEINHDQEFDDPYLILCVRLPTYAANTRKRIDVVWQEFEGELHGQSGWVTATTDFRRVQTDSD